MLIKGKHISSLYGFAIIHLLISVIELVSNASLKEEILPLGV
jgi:hypothetical protein